MANIISIENEKLFTSINKNFITLNAIYNSLYNYVQFVSVNKLKANSFS